MGLLLETIHDVETAVSSHSTPEGDAIDLREIKSSKNGRSRNDLPSETDSNFRETMKKLIAERWDAVWRAIPVALEGTDIEGVHDVRVASRRLRAAMDIAAPVFPSGWYRSLHRAAKEITGALGEVRDRDVLLESLLADRESAPLAEHPGIDRLIARIERERAEARVEMERFLDHLLNGPLRGEVERRFRMTEASGDSMRAPAGEKA
jgi:CHAD domain-containing protein